MASAPRASLTIRTGPGRGLSFEVEPQTTVGRSPRCTVPVDDPDASRTHFVIEFDAGEYVLRDNGSANGTYLNGRRVQSAGLRHGDQIGLGSTTLLFEIGVLRSTALQSVTQSAPVDGSAAPFSSLTRGSGPDALFRALEHHRLLFQTAERLADAAASTAPMTNILARLAEVMNADVGVLLLGTSEAALEVAAEFRRSSQPPSPLSSTVLRRVLLEGEAVLVRDTLQDDRLSDSTSILALGSRTLVCAPLRAGGASFGALQLEASGRPQPFDQDDLHLLVALARQAATVLAHARADALRETAVRRAELRRFVGADIAEAVLTGSVTTTPRLATLAFLFVDLRPLVAELRPGLSDDVNPLVAELVEGVFRHRGTVTRLTPDALMACFGAPQAERDAARLAVETGLDLAAAWSRSTVRGAASLRASLHWGSALAGAFGGTSRRDYAILGPDVELTARLSALVPGGSLAASEAFFTELSTQLDGAWLEVTGSARLFVVSGLR